MLRASARTVEAEAALRTATRANPAFAEAWYNLADLLDHQGRAEAGIECLRKAIVVTPGYIDAMFNLALLLQRKGAFAEATDYWRQLLEVSIRDALIDIFGEGTPQYRLYSPAATIDTVPISYAFKVPHNEIVKGLVTGKARAVALLGQAVKSLQGKLADLRAHGSAEAVVRAPSVSKDIFIVHGHDERAKVEVALMIQRASLNPVILAGRRAGDILAGGTGKFANRGP